MKKKSKIVVVGSKSFIAKNVIKRFKKKDIIFEIKKPKYDLLISKSLTKLQDRIKDQDTIIFVAAEAPVKTWKNYYRNIRMINNFLDTIKTIRLKNFVYISSDAVFSDSKKLITEKTKKEPENLHGLMHLNRENIIKSRISSNILTILRPTLVYGKGDKHNGYGPNYFFNQIKNSENIKIFGKGEELRDHIHIDDLSSLIYQIINHNYIGEFNLVTGKVLTFNYIAKSMVKHSKSNISINYIKRSSPMPHNGFRAFNNKKILDLLKNFKFTNFIKTIEKL